MNRNDIIERIQNLTDEQFSLLLTLYSQQFGEFDLTDPAPSQTSA